MKAGGRTVNFRLGVQVYEGLQALWTGLMHPRCRFCRSPAEGPLDLCPDCAFDLPRPGPACPRCQAPLPRTSPLPCGACLRRPPAFDAVWAPFRYGPPLDRLIQAFKYGQDLAAGRSLALLMLRDAPPPSPLPDCLVPVPLHSRRQRERGFNQAAELCRHLAGRLGLPCRPLLRRTRPTRAQSRLSARERNLNLAGAFASVGPCEGLHVGLVDDVMTTGTTAHRAASELKRSGANRVTVWIVARA